jgi:putative DNA primase/helicase
VIGELVAGERVQCFESTWDGLDYLDKSGEQEGIIITRGAGNAKLAEAVPSNCTLYVWTQNDEAAHEWERTICADFKGTVKRCKIPAPHKDLNDWTRGGATCDDLLQAMLSAETLREAHKTWADALDESIVTSSELHGLELTPRKKLLGDWFSEGDCGFIFAFRGVGKTWFALAIAQALSTGGKLGDWEAHNKVKVLYADGEMPADLMRIRCTGLEANNDKLQFLNHEILFDRTGKALNITNPEVQQAIIERCVRSGVKVLILDNLSTLASGMKENEADSWERVNNWLLDLRRRKIAVVIVHHAGRSGEMRGTSRREDNVFWIIALDDAKKHADDTRGARFTSHFTKPSRNTQEEIPAYQWWFVTDKATGIVSIGHKQAQTLDVFRSIIEAGVTECDQIAAEMKVQKYTVSRLAKKAIDAGWLRKKGRNYELVKTEDEEEKDSKKEAKK